MIFDMIKLSPDDTI